MEVMQSEGIRINIIASGIGRKVKRNEKVKRYLAKKAGIEEKELTVVQFKLRSGNEKGICVLKANVRVADKITKIQKDFHNWKVRLFPMKSSTHTCLDECLRSEQSPLDVTITYSDATFRSSPSTDLLQTKLEDKFKKFNVSRQYDATFIL